MGDEIHRLYFSSPSWFGTPEGVSNILLFQSKEGEFLRSGIGQSRREASNFTYIRKESISVRKLEYYILLSHTRKLIGSRIKYAKYNTVRA